MERIEALISKLQEQAARQADPAQMMLTLQLLQSELQQLQNQRSKKLGTSKVAVVMPSASAAISAGMPRENIKTENGNAISEDEPASIPASKYAPKPNKQIDMEFDPLTEIPTLSHQKIGKDLNESITGSNESLNERLKENKKELSEKLNDSPIRDLRKAIGINDRFLFIHELFRGDESMYERSLKTINSFNIYAEAEYWMSRELKVKLGWEDDSEAAQHFYQLVKRRFS